MPAESGSGDAGGGRSGGSVVGAWREWLNKKGSRWEPDFAVYLLFALSLAGRHGCRSFIKRCRALALHGAALRCVALRCVALRYAALLHLHAVFLQEEDQSALVLLTAHHLELEATTLGAMKLGAAAGEVRAFSHWYFLFFLGPDTCSHYCRTRWCRKILYSRFRTAWHDDVLLSISCLMPVLMRPDCYDPYVSRLVVASARETGHFVSPCSC